MPLAKADAKSGWMPTRPLGGWLATYGKIDENGRVVPTVDRQGHIFEAARTIGQIDFSDYLGKGRWNDTHLKPKVWVGVPTSLEHHDESSELAKAHRKVGWWTEGHLYDRFDPRSWTLFGDYEPTVEDLAKADHFWQIATMLRGLPRPLGFSAEGQMLLSPCKSRIIWARVDGNAVCEVPQNPDTAASPLALAVPDGTPLVPEMAGRLPCDTCSCPAGARCKLTAASAAAAPLAKAQTIGRGTFASAGDPYDPTTLVEVRHREAAGTTDDDLIALVMRRFGVTQRTARRWVQTWRASLQRRQRAAQERT